MEAQKAPLNCIPGLAGKTDRQRFIVKVYTLMCLQVLVTVIWVIAIKAVESLREFVVENIFLFYVALVGSLAVMFSLLCCCKRLARQHPINLLMLAAYTIFESYMVGAICIFYPINTILAAMCCTNALFIGLTLYALFTKKDLTYMGGMLFGMSLVLLVVIIFNFIFYIPILHTIILVAILILACLYVIYDTQLIAGKGKH